MGISWWELFLHQSETLLLLSTCFYRTTILEELSHLSFGTSHRSETLRLIPTTFLGLFLPKSGSLFLTLKYFNINDNWFYGTIPISMSNATKLNNVQLYGNNFTGIIPRGLGSLQNLVHFDLCYNQLEARNAAEWGFLDDLANCSNLLYLQLTGNKFSGFLPQSIANFSNSLEWFEIDHNQIAGSFPAGIGNLVSLTQLRMNSNRFTGVLPEILGNLWRLHVVDLSDNYFTGEIPRALGNLKQLLEIHLHSNQLQGSIPPSLGNCPLDLLDLALNKLNGTLPKEILSIPTLTRLLNVSHNSLQGSLPYEIGKMKNLGKLDISGNRLSGTIPSSLGECQLLDELDMSGNVFQGPIPSSFNQLKGLQSLDLSRNNLSGQIPESLQKLPFLSYLNLSFNNLEGEVPKEGIFENVTAFSVLGNSKLCGGDPHLKLPSCLASTKKHLSRKIVVSISTPCAVLILLLSLFVTLYSLRKLKKNPNANTSIKDSYMKVSYVELLRATNHFSTSNMIGGGSFGSVYKGVLNSQENKVVAVKVLNLQQKGASRSFIAECDALRNIRHRNLVKILTACASTDFRGNDFKALVYEFMPNKSLENWLHAAADEQSQQRKLSFVERLNILIDVASALDYLHNHAAEPIIHCDIKPSNVLLDNDMVAHVGGFGLVRFLNRIPTKGFEISSSSIILKGSVGYVAPEYGVANKISAEGDIYSYGILVLETLTGKRPTDEAFKDGLSLPQYVEMALPERVMEIVDPNLHFVEEDGVNGSTLVMDCITDRVMECMRLALRIGITCANASPAKRTQIGDAISDFIAIKKVFYQL